HPLRNGPLHGSGSSLAKSVAGGAGGGSGSLLSAGRTLDRRFPPPTRRGDLRRLLRRGHRHPDAGAARLSRPREHPRRERHQERLQPLHQRRGGGVLHFQGRRRLAGGAGPHRRRHSGRLRRRPLRPTHRQAEGARRSGGDRPAGDGNSVLAASGRVTAPFSEEPRIVFAPPALTLQRSDLHVPADRINPYSFATAARRWCWSTLASGSATTRWGSKGQRMRTSFASPAPRTIVVRASRYSGEAFPLSSNRSPRVAATSTGMRPVPAFSTRTVTSHPP